MQFEEGAALYSYEAKREGGEDVLYFNYLGVPYVPSLVEDPKVMERTIDLLIQNPNVSRIVFVQQNNYNHDSNETFLLLEIANFYTYLTKQEKILSYERISSRFEDTF